MHACTLTRPPALVADFALPSRCGEARASVLARVAPRGVWLKFCTHKTLKRSANAHVGLGRVRAELAAATTFQATQSFSGAMIGSATLRKSEDSANATTSRARSSSGSSRSRVSLA